MTSWPRWLMIASMAIAVLPVCRSPMISSRWPRPIGMRASMALMPVWSGSFTGWRCTTPGALNSTGRKLVVSIGPRSSMRVAQRVDHTAQQGLADGHLDDVAGAADRVALLDEGVLAEQHDADVVLLEVQHEAGHAVGSSSISRDTHDSSPWTRAMPSPTWRTLPTSSTSSAPGTARSAGAGPW